MAKTPSKKVSEDDVKGRIKSLENRVRKLEKVIHDIMSGHDIVPIVSGDDIKNNGGKN